MIFFLACAVLGGLVLVLQFVLGAVGLEHGGHASGHALPHGVSHEASHETGHGGPNEEHAGGLHVLSLRGLAAALAFFGLAGAAALGAGRSLGVALAAAAGAGGGAAVAVALLMRAMLRLDSDGTVRIDGAVGQLGTVYVPVPGARGGAGKVHLTLQGRMVEYQAVTSDEALPTGTPVLVVDVVGSDTLSVTRSPLPLEGV